MEEIGNEVDQVSICSEVPAKDIYCSDYTGNYNQNVN